MSDTSQGPGWWKASDEKWYPPETHPSRRTSAPAASATPATAVRTGVISASSAPPRSLRAWHLLAAIFISFIFGLAVGLSASNERTETVELAATTTTAQPTETTVPSTTTTMDPRAADPPVPAPAAQSAAPQTQAAPSGSPQSKGFVLESLQVKRDFAGDFEGLGRVIDTEGGRSASFTVTLFRAGQIVGTMNASVSEMPRNQAISVDFYSTDEFVEGVDRYEFQTDYAF